jgi:hypothetical protein
LNRASKLPRRVNWYEHLGAVSPIGPMLCAVGVFHLIVATIVHGVFRVPTILPARADDALRAPSLGERVSVHLIIYAGWAIAFGAIDWRGPPEGMIDTRFPFERKWGVIESAEWIYFSAYLVPFALPWLRVTRGALRRYSLNLWWVLGISVTCFLVFPLGAPPRPFEPTSLAGKLLAWETSREDFAAASLPSFHALWGMLCASLIATTGRAGAWIGWTWAVALAFCCLANGAHAMLDVAASVMLYIVVVKLSTAADRRRIEAVGPAIPEPAGRLESTVRAARSDL